MVFSVIIALILLPWVLTDFGLNRGQVRDYEYKPAIVSEYFVNFSSFEATNCHLRVQLYAS